MHAASQLCLKMCSCGAAPPYDFRMHMHAFALCPEAYLAQGSMPAWANGMLNAFIKHIMWANQDAWLAQTYLVHLNLLFKFMRVHG